MTADGLSECACVRACLRACVRACVRWVRWVALPCVALRRGAVRCGAVRCGAVRCGVALRCVPLRACVCLCVRARRSTHVLRMPVRVRACVGEYRPGRRIHISSPTATAAPQPYYADVTATTTSARAAGTAATAARRPRIPSGVVQRSKRRPVRDTTRGGGSTRPRWVLRCAARIQLRRLRWQ